MEVTKKRNDIIITHKIKKGEMFKFQKGAKFNSFTVYRKPQLVQGFSNQCDDLKGILLIDYDNVDLNIVEEDYANIQRIYNLPPGYLFKTKENNYHIICLKKFYQSRIYEILMKTRCDDNFKSMPIRNPFRSYVIRLSPKKGSKRPKFVKLVGNLNNLSEEVSKVHLALLNLCYKLPRVKYGRIDNGKVLKTHIYETSQ